MNVQFLQILLEEMERVDLLEELLAWSQEKVRRLKISIVSAIAVIHL